MKLKFTSIAHFIKFKKHFEKNHFLKNQVTADLRLREKDKYNKLKKLLLENEITASRITNFCVTKEKREKSTQNTHAQ